MSTDHQKYSTENQAEAIRQYAARRGLEIVRTYAHNVEIGQQCPLIEVKRASVLRCGKFGF